MNITRDRDALIGVIDQQEVALRLQNRQSEAGERTPHRLIHLTILHVISHCHYPSSVRVLLSSSLLPDTLTPLPFSISPPSLVSLFPPLTNRSLPPLSSAMKAWALRSLSLWSLTSSPSFSPHSDEGIAAAASGAGACRAGGCGGRGRAVPPPERPGGLLSAGRGQDARRDGGCEEVRDASRSRLL